MLLVLVGLPGSGKTTVGRQLARRLHLPFVDSDHAIENRLGLDAARNAGSLAAVVGAIVLARKD